MLKVGFPMLHKIKWTRLKKKTTADYDNYLFLISFKSQANKLSVVQLSVKAKQMHAHLRSHWHRYAGMVLSGPHRQNLDNKRHVKTVKHSSRAAMLTNRECVCCDTVI